MSKHALTLAGWLMPYLAVGSGLYIFHNAWAALLAYHAGILGLLRLAHYRYPQEYRSYRFLWKHLFFGLCGLLAGAAMFLLWPFLFVSPSLAGSLQAWGLTRATWPVFIGYSMVVNPLLEELYWRGWLGSGSRRPAWSDAFFAGFHLVVLAPFVPPLWLGISFLVLAASAWTWRQVTRASGSLVPAALFHLAADVSILLVIVSEVT